MECLIGLTGRDFVIIAADAMSARSVVVMKKNLSKMLRVSDKLVLATSGEAGDSFQFAEYIAKNIALYRMRTEQELSPSAAANFTRRQIANYLRSRSPYAVNMLIGGINDEGEGELYFLDYLGSMVKTNFAMHGYGAFFGLSIFDRFYRPDMTIDEAMNLLSKVICEVQKRLIIQLSDFQFSLLSKKDGVVELNKPLAIEEQAKEDVKMES
ncbi:hypothetical protein SNEBB_008831 [Seison nebaliae]|nr:hypothetical protein SNEBB_008831 [Seison nebaliae]